MKEPLDLNFSISGVTSIYPSKDIEGHGQKLLLLPDLAEKLQYYNKYICSLAYSSREGLHCYGERDHFDGVGKIFFSTVNPKENLDFKIYLEERQKEINRLKILIDNQTTYFNKLQCFIEQKAGQIRFDELKVENNAYIEFIANGGGVVPKHLWGDHTEIDLRPNGPDERRNFNFYLRNYVEKLIKNPSHFHWVVTVNYDGFLSIPAIIAFTSQIEKAFNRRGTIRTELNRIEGKFYVNSFTNYIDFLYPYKIENVEKWQAALFNAMINGYEYDYSRKELSVDDMKAFIHVEQVFKYYKQVHLLLEENKPIVNGFSRDLYNNLSLNELHEIVSAENNKVAERFRVNGFVSKADSERNPRLKEGEPISYDKEYKTSKEAFTFLTEYYSSLYLQYEKTAFYSKYKVWNDETIKAEIEEIEEFIERAETEKYSKACEAFAMYQSDKDEYIYKRLKNGFYEHLEIERYPLISSIGNREAMIYGRYFLFYDFLKQIRNENKSETNGQSEAKDFTSFIEALEKQEQIKKEQLQNGFNALEAYTIKNVHEDVHADISRLNQLKRNLLNWKAQLRAVFIEPENNINSDVDYFNAMKSNAERMERKILSALEILELRINHKKQHDYSNKETWQIKERPNTEIIVEPLKTQSKEIEEKLLQFGFNTYLHSKGFNESQVQKLMKLLVLNQLPYKIALLNELGYIDYITKEYCNNRTTKRDELIGKIFDQPERKVKGNINVLNKKSRENKITFTSHKYREEVIKIIKGL